MASKKIDIAIPCGNNSDYYVDFLLENFRKTMTSPEEVRIILGINNYEQFDLGVLDKFRNLFEIEHVYINTSTAPGSVGHGLTLNAMLDKMTAPIGMFCDCDMAFLRKGWDEVFRNSITNEISAFGLAYPNTNKYAGWPSLVACSFDVSLVKSLGINFCPLLDPPSSEYIVQTDIEAEAWGKKKGEKIILDCGFQFPLRLHQAGKKATTIRYKGTLVGDLRIGQEYDWDGKPFASHLKGSSIQDAKNMRTIQWTDAVKRYMLTEGL